MSTLSSWWFNRIFGGFGVSVDIEYIDFYTFQNGTEIGHLFVPHDKTKDIVKSADPTQTAQTAGATPKTLEWTHDKNGQLTTPVDIRHATKDLEIFVTFRGGTSTTTAEIWATASADTQTGSDTLLATSGPSVNLVTIPQKMILPAGKYLTLVRKSGTTNVTLIKAVTIERG